MNLYEASKDRNNNLNFIRFIAATFVVLCHAYPLGMGGGGIDALGRLTKGQIHLGGLAVYTLFFFSGFFLNRSVNKGKGAYKFFTDRCIRIFPCLIAIVFVCSFILGPIVTRYGVVEYFSDVQTYEYILNCILVLEHELPGVFENNIYNATVNGSLWTLPVEFLCYIGCYFAWRVGLLKEKIMKCTIPFFILGYVAMNILLTQNELLKSALCPCGMFYCGMLCDVYRSKIRIMKSYVLLGIMGLVLSTYFGILKYGIIIFSHTF